MDGKAYLSRARDAEARIRALAERRRRCGELAALCGGKPGPNLAALQAELEGQIEDYAALVREIAGRIDGVSDPVCRDVLRYRYLNGWSWQAIAARTRMSRGWLMKLHARGVGEIDCSRDA